MVEIRDETHEIVVTSDDILGGTPVIAGTRIPVHDVLAALAATQEQLLANYPSLTTHHVKLLASYREIYSTGALDTPLTRNLPQGARLIREYHVPRIRKG